MTSSSSTVAAVIVTYNRKDILRDTLLSFRSQTRPVDAIVVLDNASQDGTQEMVQGEFPEVTYVLSPDNSGPAGGFALGMQTAFELGHDWLWLFNDDVQLPHDLMEQCLYHLENSVDGKADVVCPIGVSPDGNRIVTGIWWRGKPVPASWSGTPASVEVDAVTFNAALFSSELVASIGYPRPDYFMMFEEWEYCVRARDAGFRFFLLPDVSLPDMKAGSTDGTSPWRSYYQTRNHLAMAKERGSVREMFWWGVRQLKFCVGIILRLDSKPKRLRFRVLGAWHGLIGRKGRTIEPG